MLKAQRDPRSEYLKGLAASSATDWWLGPEIDSPRRMPAETFVDHMATIMLGAINGTCELLGIKIDPDLLKDGDAEMLEDMLLAAVNKALESSHKLSEEKMAPFTNMLSGFGMGR